MRDAPASRPRQAPLERYDGIPTRKRGNEQKTGRVLCVTSSFPRWTGDNTTPFVLNLAQDLQSLGWQVDVLAPHAPNAAVSERLDGVNVERFRYLWPASLETVCYQGGALVNLRKRPLDKLKLPALVAAEWAAVARRLATRRYDVLHTHWMLPQGFVGILSQRIGGLPHVNTVHGGDLFGLSGRLLQGFKRMVIRHADAVTVNSRYTQSALLELAPQPAQLMRIPMGVATNPPTHAERQQSVEIRARYRRGNGPLLAFVGRIIDEKGPEDLIRAVALLRAELPNVTALIIGAGPEAPELERLAATLGLGEHILFPGWVERAEIGAWMSAADYFVAPSRRAPNGWVEAQGLTIIEAMIAGTPVIATRLGGIPDAVIHERTGLLIDERAPEQIAEAIRRLVAEPTQARSLANEAQRHAATNFSRAASARAFGDLFRELMDRSGVRR
ncbi:glycosyltransferase family 4 protein [Thiocystis violascens]|uniref:glycosyltransferase family 4 protein n=1 Tax=Thiocystis violascens TaxID=73141 RepID=UPI001FDFE63A|nr:glycosyltransferase family 4 protein [Thiocystis violascens]